MSCCRLRVATNNWTRHFLLYHLKFFMFYKNLYTIFHEKLCILTLQERDKFYSKELQEDIFPAIFYHTSMSFRIVKPPYSISVSSSAHCWIFPAVLN